jgi:hypothetical protein
VTTDGEPEPDGLVIQESSPYGLIQRMDPTNLLGYVSTSVQGSQAEVGIEPEISSGIQEHACEEQYLPEHPEVREGVVMDHTTIMDDSTPAG